METRRALIRSALETLRGNPMQTLMSLLGLVIGVAALVGVLSLGDGMEAFGRQQLETTTSLHGMVVRARTTRMVDGVTLPREAPARLDLSAADALSAMLGDSAQVMLVRSAAAEVGLPGSGAISAARVQAVSAIIPELSPFPLVEGRWLTDQEIRAGEPVAMVASSVLARLFDGAPPSIDTDAPQIRIGQRTLSVVGIYDSHVPAVSGVVAPVSLADLVPEGGTVMQLRAARVEEIPAITERIQDWSASRFQGDAEAVSIETNEMRVEQVRKGILLFKLIMGLITGISVLVGGVGIMNVMTMSVKERTKEIGIRKATGARKRDIVFQFLVESITVSMFGCLIGVLAGLAGIFAVTPIVKAITDVPFQAGFSWGTIVVVAFVGAVVGILFGTYPAFRAARLNPVEAMRYE